MMRLPANINSPALALLFGMMLVGCSGPAVKISDAEEPANEAPADARGFDPLEYPADRRVIPEESPRSGAVIGKQVLVEAIPTESPDTAGVVLNTPEPQQDTLNSQAFRVQLFTSRVYGEAHKAARIAEEIFDQPVYVDYEVPNYKVRVGSFSDRDDAMEYQQQARTAGYTNAWVVMVTVEVKEVAPLYDGRAVPLLPPELAPDSTGTVPTVEDEGDSEG